MHVMSPNFLSHRFGARVAQRFFFVRGAQNTSPPLTAKKRFATLRSCVCPMMPPPAAFWVSRVHRENGLQYGCSATPCAERAHQNIKKSFSRRLFESGFAASNRNVRAPRMTRHARTLNAALLMRLSTVRERKRRGIHVYFPYAILNNSCFLHVLFVASSSRHHFLRK